MLKRMLFTQRNYVNGRRRRLEKEAAIKRYKSVVPLTQSPANKCVHNLIKTQRDGFSRADGCEMEFYILSYANNFF